MSSAHASGPDLSGMYTTIGPSQAPDIYTNCLTEESTKERLSDVGSKMLRVLDDVYGTEGTRILKPEWQRMVASREGGAAALAYLCGDIAKQLHVAATLKGTGSRRGSMAGGGSKGFSDILRACDRKSRNAQEFVSHVGSKNRVEQNIVIRLMCERAAADLDLAASVIEEKAREAEQEGQAEGTRRRSRSRSVASVLSRKGPTAPDQRKDESYESEEYVEEHDVAEEEETDEEQKPKEVGWLSASHKLWADLSSRASSVSGRTWAGVGAAAVGVTAVAAATAWYLSSRGTDGTGSQTEMWSAPSYHHSGGGSSSQRPEGSWEWRERVE